MEPSRCSLIFEVRLYVKALVTIRLKWSVSVFNSRIRTVQSRTTSNTKFLEHQRAFCCSEDIEIHPLQSSLWIKWQDVLSRGYWLDVLSLIVMVHLTSVKTFLCIVHWHMFISFKITTLHQHYTEYNLDHFPFVGIYNILKYTFHYKFHCETHAQLHKRGYTFYGINQVYRYRHGLS